MFHILQCFVGDNSQVQYSRMVQHRNEQNQNPKNQKLIYELHTVITWLDQMIIVGAFQQNYSILLLTQLCNFRFNNFCLLFLILNFVYPHGVVKFTSLALLKVF